MACRSRCLLGRLEEPVEDRGQAPGIGGAGFGELNAAAVALEKLEAEPLLQLTHVTADRGVGDEQLLGSHREVFVPCRYFKGTQCVEGWKSPSHD